MSLERLGVFALTVLLCSACGLGSSTSRTDRKVEVVQKGTGIAPLTLREDSPVQSFPAHAEVGDFLRWQVWQEGVDILLRLVAPNGEVVHEVDSPYGKHGPEDLVAIVETAGDYRLEIETLSVEAEASHGVARPEAVVLHPSSRQDRQWVEADRRFRSGRKLIASEDLERGVQRLQRALSGFTSLGLIRQQAEVHDALALHQGRRRQLDTGIAHAQQAAVLFAAASLPRREGLALQRVGVWQLARDRVSASIDVLEKSLALLRKVGNLESAANVHSQLGNAYRRLGNLQTALAHCGHAIDLMTGDVDRITARAYHNRASALLTLNRPWQAAEAYAAASETYRKLDLDPAYELAAEEGRANATALAGDLDEGLKIAQAVEAATAVRPPDATRVKILITLGRIHRLRDEHKAAAVLFQQASSLAQTLGVLPELATAELEMGYLEMLGGDLEASLARHAEALKIFSEIEEFQGIASAQLRSAETLDRLDRPLEALERVTNALGAVETIRSTAGQRSYRLAYFAWRQEYFDLAVDLLIELSENGKNEARLLEALDVHEKSRARELILARSRVREPAEGRPSAVEHIEARLALLVTEPSFEREEEERQEIETLLEALDAEWSKATQQRTVAPTGSVEFRDRFLDEDTLALIFAEVGDRFVLWALDRSAPTRFSTLELPLSASRYASVLSRAYRGATRLEPEIRRRMNSELSQALFGPVQDLLGRRRLVLVLDGALEWIPFAALPSPHDPERYLVEDHEIVILPSMTAMPLLDRADVDARPPRFAAFGDPVFSAEDPRVSEAAPPATESPVDHEELRRLAERTRADYFERLPFTRDELYALDRAITRDDSLLAFDFDANREVFLAVDAEKYPLLHVATHAAVHPDSPELSGLIFSLVDAAGHARPGIVRAYEIRRTRLPFELVNLSACSTSIGHQTPGEGLLSLARAFLDAGAQQVVSSLWEVEDRPTALLMASFYEAYVEQGLSASAALRNAQLTLLSDPETASPESWSPFIFQGDWRPTSPFHRGGSP